MSGNRNRPEVLEVLLKKSRIHVDSVNKAGNTPLHIAVGKQQKGCVEMLIRYNANVNAQVPDLSDDVNPSLVLLQCNLQMLFL